MAIKAQRSGNIRARNVIKPISNDIYRPHWIPVRPGAQDHEQVPSRMGDRRVWRDGRVEVKS